MLFVYTYLRQWSPARMQMDCKVFPKPMSSQRIPWSLYLLRNASQFTPSWNWKTERALQKNWLLASSSSVQTAVCSIIHHCQTRSLFPTINASITASSLTAEGNKGRNRSDWTAQGDLALQWRAATISLSKAQHIGHSLRKMREGKKLYHEKKNCINGMYYLICSSLPKNARYILHS